VSAGGSSSSRNTRSRGGTALNSSSMAKWSYAFLPVSLHAKAVLVEDRDPIVGTANFDDRSFRLNFKGTR
jgi:phosphatidylserine/phosphatidylglycerophosphate/cardiolipin synthase-like enzyme